MVPAAGSKERLADGTAPTLPPRTLLDTEDTERGDVLVVPAPSPLRPSSTRVLLAPGAPGVVGSPRGEGAGSPAMRPNDLEPTREPITGVAAEGAGAPTEGDGRGSGRRDTLPAVLAAVRALVGVVARGVLVPPTSGLVTLLRPTLLATEAAAGDTDREVGVRVPPLTGVRKLEAPLPVVVALGARTGMREAEVARVSADPASAPAAALATGRISAAVGAKPPPSGEPFRLTFPVEEGTVASITLDR